MTDSKTKPLIAIVDDDEAVCASLRAVLATYGYRIIEYHDALGIINALAEVKPDCIVLDIRLPGMSGAVAQRVIAQRGDGTPVILITGHGDVSMAVTAIKNGAWDFIEKPIDDVQLVASIESAIAARAKLELEQEKPKQLSERFETLTARERTVAKMVSEGYSSAAIASHLGISGRTVDHHRSSIMAKMQATSLPQLLHFLLSVRIT